MQTENLFELTYILLDKKSVTAKEMAEHFGVSPRTIYRWVDALNLAGVPVYTSKGKGGGIFLSDKYALDKTLFTDEEKQELLASIQAVSSLSGASSSQSAISKMRSLVGNIAPSNERDKSNWIQIDFEPWSSKGTEVQELFLKLKSAILSEKQVSFDYYSMHGESEGRSIQPWKLVFKNQAWYLYGWCNQKNEERFFKLNRMRNLAVLSKPVIKFCCQQSQPVQRQPKAPDFKLIEVVLETDAQLLPTLLDEFKADSVEDSGNGKKRVSLKMPDFPWIENTLLSFADEITVLEPEDLRKRLKQRINRMMQHYSDDGND